MAEMSSRERLLAAYGREEVDRVPCSPRIWAWLLDYYGSWGLEELLRAKEEFGFDPHWVVNPFTNVAGLGCAHSYNLPGVDYERHEWMEGNYRVVRRTFHTPAGTVTDVTKFPPPGRREYGISPNPIRTEYLIKKPEDIECIPYILPDRRRTDFSGANSQKEKLGEQGLCMINIFSPLCHGAGDVYPMTELMISYYSNRDFFNRLLDIFHRDMISEVHAALNAGFKHIFANWYYNSLSVGWSPKIWEDSFAPQLRELTELVHSAGGTVNFYDDGRCMPILELLADCGIDVLQTLTPPPVGDVDLAEAKRRIGDRVCLMGYVDIIYVIQRGTPELIEHTVRHAIEVASPGGGFILGTSDSIRDGTPLENVRAYFQAARKYGLR